MTSNEYIINELNLLLEKIQNIRVRYEFDQMSSMHIIEIVPDDVYRNDALYLEWEDDLFSRFIEKFPTENICFISDKSYIEVKIQSLLKKGLVLHPSRAKMRIASLCGNLKSLQNSTKCLSLGFH